MTQTRLTQQQGFELAGQVQRLHELSSSALVVPNAEAEKRGLTNLLSAKLLEHAPELIGCWIAVQTEYEPLVNAFASLTSRAQGILRDRLAQAAEQAKKLSEAKEVKEV